MLTVKSDNKRRVILPDIKPGQVFCLESPGEGQFLLTVVKKKDVKPHDPYPEGSLKHLVTRESNRELKALCKGIPIAVPEDIAD